MQIRKHDRSFFVKRAENGDLSDHEGERRG